MMVMMACMSAAYVHHLLGSTVLVLPPHPRCRTRGAEARGIPPCASWWPAMGLIKASQLQLMAFLMETVIFYRNKSRLEWHTNRNASSHFCIPMLQLTLVYYALLSDWSRSFFFNIVLFHFTRLMCFSLPKSTKYQDTAFLIFMLHCVKYLTCFCIFPFNFLSSFSGLWTLLLWLSFGSTRESRLLQWRQTKHLNDLWHRI